MKVVLDHQIDINLYERKALSDKKNNFKNTLIAPQSDLANDLQKDSYIFNLPLLKEKYVEKELEESMVERIRDELLELGNGFSFIGNQYKLTVEYSLKGVDKPIGVSSYEISKYLPKNLEKLLPTEEDINIHIELEGDEEND